MSKKKRGLKRHSDGAAESNTNARRACNTVRPRSTSRLGAGTATAKRSKQAILAEGDQVYSDFAEAMARGPGRRRRESAVTSLSAGRRICAISMSQASIDCAVLGQLYNSHPEFIANFQDIHPELPAYLERIIEDYVDELETAELERMLAEDEAMEQRRGQAFGVGKSQPSAGLRKNASRRRADPRGVGFAPQHKQAHLGRPHNEIENKRARQVSPLRFAKARAFSPLHDSPHLTHNQINERRSRWRVFARP